MLRPFLFATALLGVVGSCGDPPPSAEREPAATPALLAPAFAIAPAVAAIAAARVAPRGPCPAEMAHVDGGCIDRWEATLVERRADGSFAPHAHAERPKEGVTYEARSVAGVLPQAYVSRDDATAACANAGKRLCSRDEWQRACEGEARTIYPYGPKREPGRCNTDKPHLVTLLFGANANAWRYEDFNDPRLDQEPGFLAKTGEFDACVSEAGAYDLVGNLHEWVSDTVDHDLLAKLAVDASSRSWQPSAAGNGVFMGGFFSTREELGPGCHYTTIAHEPGYHDYSTGFRCCADASE